MSPAQLAYIVAAYPKWIQNVQRLLSRPPRPRTFTARWLGLVRALRIENACSLHEAGRVADLAMAAGLEERWLRVQRHESARAELVVDLWRDHSIFLARLSYATTNPARERRGRPATKRTKGNVIARARAFGVDISRLRSGLTRTASERLARLDDNIAFLAEGRASLARRRSVI